MKKFLIDLLHLLHFGQHATKEAKPNFSKYIHIFYIFLYKLIIQANPKTTLQIVLMLPYRRCLQCPGTQSRYNYRQIPMTSVALIQLIIQCFSFRNRTAHHVLYFRQQIFLRWQYQFKTAQKFHLQIITPELQKSRLDGN